MILKGVFQPKLFYERDARVVENKDKIFSWNSKMRSKRFCKWLYKTQ